MCKNKSIKIRKSTISPGHYHSGCFAETLVTLFSLSPVVQKKNTNTYYTLTRLLTHTHCPHTYLRAHRYRGIRKETRSYTSHTNRGNRIFVYPVSNGSIRETSKLRPPSVFWLGRFLNIRSSVRRACPRRGAEPRGRARESRRLFPVRAT